MKSLRNIFSALFVIGAFALVTQGTYLFVGHCLGNGDLCVANALIGYEQSFETYDSTPTVYINAPTTFDMVISLVGIVGQYLLVLSVFVLIVLEIIQLHYLRNLLGKRGKLV